MIDSGGFLSFKTSNVGDQLLFSSMLLSSSNFMRSSLRYATALPMKYSFVVTVVTEFAMLTDLMITTSRKLSCIGWRKSSLQNFTTSFDWLRQISLQISAVVEVAYNAATWYSLKVKKKNLNSIYPFWVFFIIF